MSIHHSISSCAFAQRGRIFSFALLLAVLSCGPGPRGHVVLHSPSQVGLGGAGNFAVLAKTGISTVPSSSVTGDIGLSPAAGSYLNGFGLTADSSNTFSTSPQVT